MTGTGERILITGATGFLGREVVQYLRVMSRISAPAIGFAAATHHCPY